MLLLALYSEASEDQLAQLKELGCEMAQGFYFAEPLPSEAVESLLRGHLLVEASPQDSKGMARTLFEDDTCKARAARGTIRE
jgi:hypothetical protein